MTDIVERLRFEAFDAVNWDGETMKQWDKIRKQAETLPGSDLPRLMFQGLIESLAELMVESAFEIERLRNDAQTAWQPIETAPKDGTKILLRDPLDDTVVVGFWSKGEDNGKACWRLCWDHAPFAPYYDAAVWAHLPALPSAERPQETAADNAALIAAIPEMVQVLTLARAHIDACDYDTEAIALSEHITAVLQKVKQP